MDVNPYQFKAPFADFEFSNYHLSQKTNLVLCSMAWNKGEEAPKKEKVEPKPKSAKSKARADKAAENAGLAAGDQDEDSDDDWEDEEDEEELERQALELQYDTINYWAVRMNPFYSQTQIPLQETIMVVANRIGTEAGMGSLFILALFDFFVRDTCEAALTFFFCENTLHTWSDRT